MLRRINISGFVVLASLSSCGGSEEKGSSEQRTVNPSPTPPAQATTSTTSATGTTTTSGGGTSSGSGTSTSTGSGNSVGGTTSGTTTGAPGTGGTPIPPTTPNLVLQGVVGIQSNGGSKIKFPVPLDADCHSIHPNGSLQAIWKLDPPNAVGVIVTDANLCEPTVEIYTDPLRFPNAADRFHENQGIKIVGFLPSGNSMGLQNIEYRAVVAERSAPSLLSPTTPIIMNSDFKAYSGTPGLNDGFMFASADDKSIKVYRVPNLVNDANQPSYQKGVYFAWGYMSHPFQFNIPVIPLDPSLNSIIRTTDDYTYKAVCESSGPTSLDAAPLIPTSAGVCQDYCPFDLTIQNGFAIFKLKYTGTGVTSSISSTGVRTYVTRKTMVETECWQSTKDKAKIDLKLKITNSAGGSNTLPVGQVLVDVDNK